MSKKYTFPMIYTFEKYTFPKIGTLCVYRIGTTKRGATETCHPSIYRTD